MTEITLAGNKIHTFGELPPLGSMAPEFTLTDKSMLERSLKSFIGNKIILNIFVSIDTDVCSMSVRRFNTEASSHPDTVVLCISADLPFALSRFCGAEGLENVVVLSSFRNKSFGEDYGVSIIDGPLTGLLSRAVIIIDEKGKIIYTQQVPEIGDEPDYETAISMLQ